MMEIERCPTTVNEAIEVLVETLTEDQRSKIIAMSESELIDLHFGLGMWIRNSFGLLSKESALLKDTGARNADSASGAIIRLLWRRLRGEQGNRTDFA